MLSIYFYINLGVYKISSLVLNCVKEKIELMLAIYKL